jgi:cyclase
MKQMKIMIKTLLLSLLLCVSTVLQAQETELELLHVQGQVWMVAGGGGNTTLLVGEEGIVVVDTKLAQASDQLIALLKDEFDVPIRWIINTHIHADHVGGNSAVSLAGEFLTGGPAAIYAHAGVMVSMVTDEAEFAAEALPGNTYGTPSMEFYSNGEAVQLIHQPAAHTDGDSIVYFRGSNVLAAGDIFTLGIYPIIDVNNGGSVRGYLDALNNMLAIAIPNGIQQAGTYIIPGHGRITDEYELVNYRDMLTVIYERIEDAVARGLSLEQVKAERLTRDYDPIYGADSGFWTTERFIEVIYAELSEQ